MKSITEGNVTASFNNSGRIAIHQEDVAGRPDVVKVSEDFLLKLVQAAQIYRCYQEIFDEELEQELLPSVSEEALAQNAEAYKVIAPDSRYFVSK